MQPTTNGSVTYIKDGNLKTITLNSRNRKKVLDDIFETSYYGSYNQLTANIKENIDFVHFKNIKFVDYRKFICCSPCMRNNETICIFENCTLELKNTSSIYFKYGTFKLINVKLDNIDGIVTIQGKEFHLHETNNLNQSYGLILNSNNIYLSGNLKFSRFSLYSRKITIGDLKSDTKLTLKEHGDIYPEIDITTNELILNKSAIICNFGGYIGQSIISSKIIIDDSSEIKSNQPININGNEYTIEPTAKFITIKKDTLKQTVTSSIIKTYNKLINAKVEREKQKILNKKFKNLKEEIEENEHKLIELKQELELKIKEQEKIIDNLKQELENQNKEIGDKISKSLKKKSVKYFESK